MKTLTISKLHEKLIRRLSTPLGIIWILSHTLMVLLGSLFLSSQALQSALGNGLSEGIGGSLIASGIAGVALFLYVSASETLKSRIEAISKAGVTNIFSGRSVLIRSEYQDRLKTARQIDLVGYGLSAFRQDYLQDFAAWSHRAKVRILLIDPEFPTKNTSIADQRDREEGHPIGQIRSDVLEFEEAVGRLRALDRKNFQIRRMKAIPAINLFRIDNEIFWGPYLMDQQSRNTATLLIERGGFLFETLERHFEALWDKYSA